MTRKGCAWVVRVASRIDEEAFVDRSKSLDDGALTFPAFGVGGWMWKFYSRSGFFDPAKSIKDYS